MSVQNGLQPAKDPKVDFLHEGVGESDFGPVDGTIASCLDEGQIIGILRIEDDVIECLLFHVSRGQLT